MCRTEDGRREGGGGEGQFRYTFAARGNMAQTAKPAEVFAFSTTGSRNYAEAEYSRNCVLLFGPETRGLPKEVLGLFERMQILRIPMVSGSRSLNLSNAVAIAVYEAWRQNDFAKA